MSQISKIIINFKTLEELSISFKDYLSLLDLYITHTEPCNIISLFEKGYVTKIGSKYIINPPIRRVLFDNIIREDKKHVEKDVEIRDIVISRIDEYRLKWKEATGDRKPGIMGSRQSCIDKLTQWMKDNPIYTFDQILQAADLYLSNQDNLKYIQRADYFISKQEKDGTTNSRLSAFIDDIDTYVSDGWTNELL